MLLENLLRNLQSDGRILHESAAAALERLLTLDGRVQGGNHLWSLASLDLEIFRALQERRNTGLTRVSPGPDDGEGFRVYYNLLGRLHIRPSSDAMLDYGLGHSIEIGFVALPSSDAAQARRRAAEADEAEQSSRARLDLALDSAGRSGCLDEIIAGVIDAVQHVEAVCLYADGELFSAMERFTNLFTTKRAAGIFNELTRQPLPAWRPVHRLLVAALHMLYQSGGSIRFEEFNGAELSARRLFSRLNELGAGYCAAIGHEQEPPQAPFELGRWVGELARQMQNRSWVRYRRSNGLTFQKREELRPPSGPGEDGISLAPRLIELHRSWCAHASPDAPREILLRDLAEHAIDDALYRPQAGKNSTNGEVLPEKTKLEVLIEEIVASAVTVTFADYGMSSSIRQPGCLFGSSPREVQHAMLSLTPKDFFCCIVATYQLHQSYGHKLESDVFRAVQARMQFNRWHFIAGNFPRPVVPKDRHYFYPPAMPDLAEWSDQFHSGHTRAGVRFAIRAPGPDMGCPPLTISGIDFRGFYDVRTVRIAGPMFTLRDLTAVRAHCLWLGEIWRRIIARCEKVSEARSAITFSSFVNGNGRVLGTSDSPRSMMAEQSL